MENNSIFTKERKGYSCSEVDLFLTEQTARHENELADRDAEIKRLFSESEDLKARLDEAMKDNQRLAAELSMIKKNSASDSDRVNARIGEKLNIADEASKEMLKKANLECELMKRKCREQIAAEVAAAKAKAEAYCDRARRAADIYVEKQQLISAGLEQARRHLDDAVSAVDKALEEKI